MKKILIYIAVFSAAIITFSSCEKSAVQVIDAPPNGPLVRFYNFAINGPSVNFFANDIKVSATNSATGIEALTGVNFGGIFPGNNNYVSIASVGNVTLKSITPSTATVNPNTTVANLSATLETGKYYSFYTSGVFDATAKTSSGFVIEDVVPAVDTSAAYVRLVNTVPNANISGFDLKALNTTTNENITIAGVTAYQSGSVFVKVPNGVYNLTSISTNTPTSYTITRTAVSFAKGLVYTITTRGDATLTTGANARALDLTRNR
jgi:hypothetical protein